MGATLATYDTDGYPYGVTGYLYLVTVATHIGYLFLLRSNIHQESFASTVPLDDGNALPPIALPTPQPAGPSVIAFHDKSGR